MTRVLCLHGLGGTGATMWPIVAACIDANFTTLAPTLPGHGTDPHDLVGITWNEWVEAARSWEADVVVGQSLGANLAMQLATEKRCRALVCINPVALDPDALEGLQWRKGRGHEWIDVAPSAVGEIAYERLPVLLVTSANDHLQDPASADSIADALGGDVQRVRLRNSGHVATLDVERHLLQAAVVDFVTAA